MIWCHCTSVGTGEKTCTRDGIFGVCFLDLAGYTSRWMLKCAEINMRRTVFANRKACPEDADPPTKLKLMSFPVRGLSRPPLLTRVRHSSSPLRRPRLLGNWYALLAALLTLRASEGSCAHRSWISLAQ